MTIIDLDTVKKGYEFLMENNDLPHRDIMLPDYITPELINKGIKILSKQIDSRK